MTIFTFSSTRRVLASWMLTLVVLLSAATLLAWGLSSMEPSRASMHTTRGQAHNRKSLHSVLQANFDVATQGMKPGPSGIVSVPDDNSAGLICSPATLDRKSSFHLVLPAEPTARKGVLAALTPDGSLRIIYESYGFDNNDTEDLVVPSKAIDWESVRSRNEFTIDVNKFDAFREDKYVSEPLFQQPGIYQFALLNSTDRLLLDANGAALWVIAGCVVRYQP
ncbi:MAG: hypothetical protein JF595_09880 [Sphingomonadales bacterium]|nr:hypothetical protein [Sphingomonadales bacterium]